MIGTVNKIAKAMFGSLFALGLVFWYFPALADAPRVRPLEKRIDNARFLQTRLYPNTWIKVTGCKAAGARIGAGQNREVPPAGGASSTVKALEVLLAICVFLAYSSVRKLMAERNFRFNIISSMIGKIKYSKDLIVPLAFVAAGVAASVGFYFLPAVYDPLIAKILPLRHIASQRQLVDYLQSLKDEKGVSIGINDAGACGGRSGNGACGMPASVQSENASSLSKQIGEFEATGLTASWSLTASLNETQNGLLGVVKNLGASLGAAETLDGDSAQNYLIFLKNKEIDGAGGQAGDDDFPFSVDKTFASYMPLAADGRTAEDGSSLASLAEGEKIDGLVVNIDDYKKKKAEIDNIIAGNGEMQYVVANGISKNEDVGAIKQLFAETLAQNRQLLLAVAPASLVWAGNKNLSAAIQVTWVVFVFFFFLPVAIMIPYHWYERRKVRHNPKQLTSLPKVTLIFPAYNEERFIHKTIEQGLKQDYKGELEIIIIDDGSTDRTGEIVKEWSVKYPQLKVFRHDVNKGKPEGLNTGFAMATGEISIFSDSDGHLDSDLVTKMVPHFADPEVGMVAGMVVIHNDNNFLTRMQQIEYLYTQEIVRFCQSAHRGVLICPGAATAVRTQIGRDIPSTERTVTEDADFTFEVAKAGWKITQEPEAISRTDGMDNYPAFVNQRKRWLYGVLQTICLHPWALFFTKSRVPNLWVWWAWLGYITCPITVLAVLAIPFFYYWIGPSYLIYLGFYSIVVGAVFVFIHWYGLHQYKHEKKTGLAWLLPAYMVYQYYLNVFLMWLVICWATRIGINCRYGGRDIHAL